MRFEVLTIFPGLLQPLRDVGVLGKAVERGDIALDIHDLRRWSGNRWGQVDDEPYGGGAGMVLQAPPVLAAVRDLERRHPEPARVVVLSPRGRLFDQELANELIQHRRLILVCGRYEGIDERVIEILRPLELSIGDFVLGGGEVAAMVVIEAVSRLVPGVVGRPESVAVDSFSDGLLDHPCFTRPAEVEGHQVPGVLRSGDHEKVRHWRLRRSVELTVTRRPDLIKKNWNRYREEVRSLIRRYEPDLGIGTAGSGDGMDQDEA